MNDDRLLLEMRRWLQEERVTLPDAERASQQIATQLPATSQRRRRWWRLPFHARTPKPPRTAEYQSQVEETSQVGRWLPFPVLHRKSKAKTPTATDTAEFQPSPIPATNGHSPTVLGRTQSMLSPVKAITAGALVFAIGGVMLVAQPFQQQGVVPGATVSEPSEAVEFTATIPWGWEVAAGTSEGLASGVVEQVGWAHRTAAAGRASASDARFDGDVVYTCNSHLYPDGQGRLLDCVFRVENAEGAWQSQPWLQLDFGNASFGPFSVFTAVFHGEDGYEGLTAVVEVNETAWTGYELHGLIVDGYLPPNAEHFEAE